MAVDVREHEVRDRGTALRRFSFDDVLHMVDAGILGRRERVELIDGELIEMSPEGIEHALTVSWLHTTIARATTDEFEVRSQSTLPIDEHTYVEPDVILGRTTGGGWPTPGTVVLVIEVALTSIARDREAKADLYARWGAREYWVVDLTRREVIVHTEGDGVRYSLVRTVAAGGVTLPGTEVALGLGDIFRTRA